MENFWKGILYAQVINIDSSAVYKGVIRLCTFHTVPRYQVSRTRRNKPFCQMRVTANICSVFHFPPPHFRGDSYGGGLAQLDGLGHLCQISSSLRNSYKNIMCSYEKWASPPRWVLNLFLLESHIDGMKMFRMNTRRWAIPARWDRFFCNAHIYVLL